MRSPTHFKPQDFRLMLAHRIWISICFGSHLLRSLWPERTVDQSVVDLRWEIVRAEALISRSAAELDRCVSASWFHTVVLKVVILLGVQLVIVWFFWNYFIRARTGVVVTDIPIAPSSPSDTECFFEIENSKSPTSSACLKATDTLATGPLRPSDLKRLGREHGHGQNARRS